MAQSPATPSGWRAQWGEVSREDIFYAMDALLHAPSYRAKFAENLKRELPRLPLDNLFGGANALFQSGFSQTQRLEEGVSPAPLMPNGTITAGLTPPSNLWVLPSRSQRRRLE